MGRKRKEEDELLGNSIGNERQRTRRVNSQRQRTRGRLNVQQQKKGKFSVFFLPFHPQRYYWGHPVGLEGIWIMIYLKIMEAS